MDLTSLVGGKWESLHYPLSIDVSSDRIEALVHKEQAEDSQL